MNFFTINKGLDLPLAGAPRMEVEDAPEVGRVALVGPDYPGMRPTMEVSEGDRVRLGQVLFSDKKNPRVVYTSPGSGRIRAINRGEKRVFLSVEVELDGNDEESFALHPESHLANLERDLVVETLLASGLWTALRRRPFGRIPNPGETPQAVFITAMDTHPLAPDPCVAISERAGDFNNGVKVLSTLTDGPLYLCAAPDAKLPDCSAGQRVTFAGPHPAGLPGTHIHYLSPVGLQHAVWHLGYQDVCAVGHLFTQGRIPTERVLSLGGPGVQRPRLIRTRIGASIDELIRDELEGPHLRVLSGSVLDGRAARGPLAFLGRYHNQITALEEGVPGSALGWLRPGGNDFSLRCLFKGAFDRQRPRRLTTARGGARRAIYPIGTYEQVFPLDLPITYLLRALEVGDMEEALALGCLELDEEDLATCTFACPGKNDFGPMLREMLDQIEKEG
ncbi:Na(+)-translocating NADH-quinone reductase subunit A [Geoalkalibacter subterraneus]|jgi:Na+-transporting NADH:ubiquinone oxidoreductase subunit A|uniref:Na(+)-translocating NADH-quinone reductase subunit A n=1 Tax=Geoalkalibacter subterraneus TaxID=483547 RepID=A0A0B5FRZ7_9BACT|nr:Na(+)-translocating NADH-quinone reductase subunit A [Geoalkalibacter subterraneus]AJF07429.1 Na(+)-translocating NADH-quinone reductase subunit A [Geoalkalibacter subterraneus]